MAISRDFRGIKRRSDGSIVVGGRNKDDEEISEDSVLEVHVILVSRPDYAHMLHTSSAGRQLTSPDWEVVFENVTAPFDRPDQEVLIIGSLKYLNEAGATDDVVWGGDTKIDG